jgi:hypothetical protein
MGKIGAILIALLAGSVVGAEPPIVGRPADFSGAIGGPFVVTASVEPQIVALEEPFILSLRIVGPGNLKDIARPELAKLESFKQFAIDDLDDAFADGSPPSRKFRYRLRARNSDETRIPPFKFVYFNPGIVPASRGFQTTYAEAVSIKQDARITSEPRASPELITKYRLLLRTNPDNHLARARLRAQRDLVPYPSNDMRPDEPWSLILILQSLLWLIIIALGFVVAEVIRWWLTRRLAVLINAVAALVAAGILLGWRERARNEETPVVVVARETALRRGNGEEYPKRIDVPLPAGVEMRRLHERHGWLQVELANGVVGWVARDAVIQ